MNKPEIIEYLICTCCGRGLEDTPEQNVAHGETPYPYDTGFGMCVECGGDKTIPFDAKDEKALRKRMGWASTMFFDARIDILREKLNPENLERFEALPYAKKVAVITRMVEKGVMI
jgi:hypothetical protein